MSGTQTRQGGLSVQQVLLFSSADMQFCVPLKNVTKVVPIVQLGYVPGGPDYLRGLMMLNGQSLPVIDLAHRLNQKNPNHYTLDTPILICTANEKLVGVIVDTVDGISDVHEGHMQMRPMFKEDGAPPFTAAIETEKGLSLLLDIEKILNIDFSAIPTDLPDDRRQTA